MLESSGFRKYSTPVVYQLFYRRLCLSLCLCLFVGQVMFSQTSQVSGTLGCLCVFQNQNVYINVSPCPPSTSSSFWSSCCFTCLHLLQLVALFSVLVWLVWWYLFWFWGMMAWSLELGQMKILINLNFWADLGTISNYAIKVNIKYEEWKKIWIHRWIIRCLENQPMKIQNTFMLNLQYLVLWWGFVSMAMALGGKVAWDFGKLGERWDGKRFVFVYKQRYHWVELSQQQKWPSNLWINQLANWVLETDDQTKTNVNEKYKILKITKQKHFSPFLLKR